MSNDDKVKFCDKMRESTRDILSFSHALVNAKLAIGFQDNELWADGLLVFYEIFRYLEGAMARFKTAQIGLLNLKGLRRTEAFERDLEFYLGENWTKNYAPRESVVKYLMRLKAVEDTDPNLLIAYIYHLYLGLLCGAQILLDKRRLVRKMSPFDEVSTSGEEITNFGDRTVDELKNEFRTTMNDIADNLDEDTINRLVEESKIVFGMNNEIIRSVRGADVAFVKKIIYIVIVLALIVFIFFALM